MGFVDRRPLRKTGDQGLGLGTLALKGRLAPPSASKYQRAVKGKRYIPGLGALYVTISDIFVQCGM